MRKTTPLASPAALPIPAVFARTYLDVVADHGGSVRGVLACAELGERELQTATVLDMGRYEALVHAVRASMGQALSIGVEQGWRLPATSFGSLGLAVLSSATLREALGLCQRFWALYGMGLTLRVREAPAVCALEFGTLPQVVAPEDRPTVLEAAITSLYRSALALLPELLASCEVWFHFPEPSYAAHVTSRLGRVRWGMPASQFRFDAALMDARMPMANAVNLRAALAACEREVASLALPGQDLASQVLHRLAWREDGYPDAELVARQLAMSARTLRRRLDAEGVSFLALRHQARVRDAKALLATPGVALAQVAQRLGYADPANFTRAFKAWTGMTPSAFRARCAPASR